MEDTLYWYTMDFTPQPGGTASPSKLSWVRLELWSYW